MWIVALALRRPYTFIVLAVLILLLGVFVILRTAIDIFPNIKIPVVAAIWSYTGLSPDEMSKRIVLFSERVAQTTVNDVQHTESQSLNGIAVVKYFFQPTVNEELSYAQITGVSQTQLRFAPPATNPPFILAYNASTVPIIQLALSSDELSESQIFDLGNNVTAAIGQQNLILPAGTQKIGDLEYFVSINASPTKIDELNDLPITTRNGSVVYVRDVAHVRDGGPPQTNMVRLEGHRAVLMNVLKTGGASTLDVITEVQRRLPQIRATLPPSLKIQVLGDQSIFVRSAASGVVREAVIAAALTGLLIMLFLASWRSTLIICISIPLSILASIICLSAIGETINIMTLGGLALAVGILVDDATVTIENINYHLEQGKDVETSIMDGAHQIALPALVSTLAICIVFIPMLLLSGIAHYLFIPLAEAVVFAMLASYVLSRTLVPTLAKYWVKQSLHLHMDEQTGFMTRLFARFEHGFERTRDAYRALLEAALHARWRFIVRFMLAGLAVSTLVVPLGRYWPGLGEDFFPSVDAGQIKLHLRARTSLRIEETAALCDRVEATIRQTIPRAELVSIVDNIGVPYSGINLAYSTSAPVGPGDAEIFVNLTPDHRPTADYVRALRGKLTALYPSTSFAFLPADMVSQILNFGLPAPLDVQVSGFNVAANRGYANALLARMHGIPGVVDLRIQQAFDYPTLNVEVDRSKAALFGLSETDVASDLLVSLSGSSQTTLSFWIDPKSGTQYSIAAQTPQFRLASLLDLAATPVTGTVSASGAIPLAGTAAASGSAGHAAQLLANLASFRRGVAPAVVSHYDATPVVDIFGAVEGT